MVGLLLNCVLYLRFRSVAVSIPDSGGLSSVGQSRGRGSEVGGRGSGVGVGRTRWFVDRRSSQLQISRRPRLPGGRKSIGQVVAGAAK